MDALVKTRKRRALSQEELAAASGVGRATISRLERGETEAHGRTLRKLAAVLEVPVEDLISEAHTGDSSRRGGGRD